METVTDFIFLGSKITADGDCSHEIERCLLLGRKAMTNLAIILKSRDITLSTKVCIVKAMVFSSSHVWMLELDHKKGWALKNWCLWTVVLEKTLESPLDCKEIQPDHPKGNQSWMFWRTDAEAETPILWPPGVKNWPIGKDPDAEKDWRREKEMTQGEMVGWHHQLNGYEFEQIQETRTGKPSMLQSMGSQRAGHSWATEQQTTKSMVFCYSSLNRLWHPEELKTTHISTDEHISTC